MNELFGCLSCRQNFIKSYDSCSYDRCKIKEVTTAPITTNTNTNILMLIPIVLGFISITTTMAISYAQ